MPTPTDTHPNASVQRMTPVLQVQALRVGYPGQPTLFDGLSFVLPAGLTRLEAEIGKTTLIRVLAGDLAAEGRFTLAGRPWKPDPQDPSVCWLDPRSAAWDGLTPDAVAAGLRSRYPSFDDSAWAAHLSGFGLDEHRHKTMHMLSTGSRRKVALAASLAAGATLTLLDEPVAGLDPPSIAALVEALASQAATAATSGRAWLIAAAWGLEERLPWAGVLAPERPASSGG